MKSIIAIAALLALGTGCAANAPAKTAKNTTPISQQASDDDMVVLPAMDSLPEGSMTFNWEPKPPPPEKKVRARKLDAKPRNLRKKRRLYALPTH